MIEVQPLKLQEVAAEQIENESPEEEFGLIEGPLGHLTGVVFDEEFFSAAYWETVTGDANADATADADATAKATATANEPITLGL